MNKAHISLQINWEDDASPMLLTGNEGEIVNANYAAEVLFGCPEEEICRMINTPASPEFKLLNNLLHRNQNVADTTLKLRKFDGADIDIELRQIKLVYDYGVESNVLLLKDVTEKKRLELQLRQSKERNDILFENKLSAICVYDFETFKFLDVNQKFIELYGYTKEELLNLTIYELTFEPEKTEKAVGELFNSGVIRIPQRYHKRKDGTVFPVEVFGNFAYWNGKPVIFVVLNDISQRLALEEKLKRNEELLKEVQNLTKIGGWEYDVSSGNTLISEEVLSIHGRQISSPNDGLADYHPDDRKLVEDAFTNAFKDSKEYDITVRLFNAEGAMLWVRAIGKPVIENGKVVKVIGSLADVTASINAQLELAKREEKYRTLFQNLDYGFELNEIITNKKGEVVDFRILEVNKYFKDFTGIEPASAIGKTIKEIMPKVDLKMIKKYGDVAITGVPFDLEYYSITFNKWIRAHVYSPKEGQFASIFQDITERKLIEKKLQESEEKYRKLFENSSAAIAVISSDRKIINTNARWCEMLGYSAKELKGAHISKYLSPLELGKLKLQEEILQKEGSMMIIREIIKKDGSRAYFEGRVTLMENGSRQIIANDITERVRIENKLSASEENYRKLFENSPAGIAIVNNNRNIINANARWCEMLGYSKQEMMEKKLDDLLSPEELALTLQQKDAMLKEIPPLVEREMLTKDGRKIYFEARVTRLNSDTRQIIATDITERKKNFEALSNYRAYLEEVVEKKTKEILDMNKDLKDQIAKQKEVEEKLKESLLKEFEINEFRKRLITNIGHEFRTPLTTILSSMELLERYGKKWGEDKWNEHKRKVNDSADYLINLINNSLKVEKPIDSSGKVNKTQLDLYQFINSSITEVADKEGGKYSFNLKYGTDKIFELDGDKLKTIITNLLSNAVKFSPNGGEIIIEVGRSNDILIIKIADKGIGISEEDMEHLFEPFYRGANAGVLPGVGLGLTIAKKYIDICGGMIKVESRQGEGSSFTINFPVGN